MYRIVAILFVSLCTAACSARLEYAPVRYASSADAIDINTATAGELERLPGIGRTTAEAIISFRNDNGPFRRVEHLMLIRGMSEGRYLEARAYLRLE